MKGKLLNITRKIRIQLLIQYKIHPFKMQMGKCLRYCSLMMAKQSNSLMRRKIKRSIM